MTYWLFDGSDVVGPFTVQQLLARGGFGSGSLVCPDEHSNEEMYWKAASCYEAFGFVAQSEESCAEEELSLPSDAPEESFEQEMIDTLVGANSPLASPDEVEGMSAEPATLEMPSRKPSKPSPIEDYFNNIKGEDLGNILGIPGPSENSDMNLQRALENQFSDTTPPLEKEIHPIDSDPFDEFIPKEPLQDVPAVSLKKTPEALLKAEKSAAVASTLPLAAELEAASKKTVERWAEATGAFAPTETPLKEEEKPVLTTSPVTAVQKETSSSGISLSRAEMDVMPVVLAVPAPSAAKIQEREEPTLNPSSLEDTFEKPFEPLEEALTARPITLAKTQAQDTPEPEMTEAESVFQEAEASALAAKQEEESFAVKETVTAAVASAPKAQGAVKEEQSVAGLPANHMPSLPPDGIAPQAKAGLAVSSGLEEMVVQDDENDPAAQTVKDILEGALKVEEQPEVKEPIKEIRLEPKESRIKPRLNPTPEIEEFLTERVVRPSRKKYAGVLTLLFAMLVAGGAFYLNQSMPQDAPAAAPAKPRSALLSDVAPSIPKTAMPAPSLPQRAVPLVQKQQPASDRARALVQNYYLPEFNSTIGEYFDRIYEDKKADGFSVSWSAEPLHKDVYIVRYRVTKTRKEPIMYIFQVDMGKNKLVGALNNVTLDLVGKIK